MSRGTIDRWTRDYRSGGFAALLPEPRKAVPRTPPEVLELAAALKRENPGRTAAQIQRILRTTQGWSPTERTLQRHFVTAGLSGTSGDRSVFGRFEATHGNELWTGDALHGPKIGRRKTYLFAFIDDHSRAIVGHRFGFAEDTVRLAVALRPALSARGVPESVYVDNGSAFVDTWLLRACASLAIRLTHSKPGRPQGRVRRPGRGTWPTPDCGVRAAGGGGRLRGERHRGVSAERSSPQAVGEARGHCPPVGTREYSNQHPIPGHSRTRNRSARGESPWLSAFRCPQGPCRMVALTTSSSRSDGPGPRPGGERARCAVGVVVSRRSWRRSSVCRWWRLPMSSARWSGRRLW
ncbi:DDE-type integrase/transposase/recombinase [Streptomyces hygroscopicus]|uniref:DDE-type integrase/transposase/recombinase n=1 Tax=Streptomyces hygroscopicus TaxID=1912 RepID=UPI0033DB8054